MVYNTNKMLHGLRCYLMWDMPWELHSQSCKNKFCFYRQQFSNCQEHQDAVRIECVFSARTVRVLPQEAHPPQALGDEGLVSRSYIGSVEVSFPPGPSCLSVPAADVLNDCLHSIRSNRPSVQFKKTA